MCVVNVLQYAGSSKQMTVEQFLVMVEAMNKKDQGPVDEVEVVTAADAVADEHLLTSTTDELDEFERPRRSDPSRVSRTHSGG